MSKDITQAESDKAFQKLADRLKRHGLPTPQGPTTSKEEYFMLMYCDGNEYHFKHRVTRQYVSLDVTKDYGLSIYGDDYSSGYLAMSVEDFQALTSGLDSLPE